MTTVLTPPPSTVVELEQILARYEASRPRSKQAALGPSEVGMECQRALAYRLLNTPEKPDPRLPWAPLVGTSVHATIAEALEAENAHLGRQRWIVETRVDPGEGVPGSCDAYDVDARMVIDWKGLSLDTLLPTPTGWTTMRAVRPGDQVIGADGRPCNVVAKSPVFERPCYRIIFEDSSTVVCDEVHEWPMLVGTRMKPRVLSTKDAAGQVRPPGQADGQRHLRVATTEPLTLPDVDLPVPPYSLGAWLGDGSKDWGRIAKPDDELFDHIAEDGYTIGTRRGPNGIWRPVYGLYRDLRLAGLLGHKAIPDVYLRASICQRLSLMQGLMDTDGTWNRTRKQAVFTSKDKSLAEAVAELARSLGWKPRVFELTKHGFGLTITAYDVVFTPHDLNPFRLSRKADLVRLNGSARSRRRVVHSIELVDSVPTQCIEVDSPDHTYLCTENMIPTHNCVGDKSLRELPGHMKPEYETQAHIYGLGFENTGLPVRWVRICLLTRSSHDFRQSREWTRPYDRQHALDALARLAATRKLITGLRLAEGDKGWAEVPGQSSKPCSWCKWYKPGPAPTRLGCPGVPR